jgi:hypothetical protein
MASVCQPLQMRSDVISASSLPSGNGKPLNRLRLRGTNEVPLVPIAIATRILFAFHQSLSRSAYHSMAAAKSGLRSNVPPGKPGVGSLAIKSKRSACPATASANI